MKITKTLVLATAMLLCSQIMKAGDGTKENPYTVAELNAAKESITEDQVVWVKADLKGLGEDGSLTENTESNQMAGLFGDATGTFVAYSYQILQGLELSDLTNKDNLLISLTYNEKGHVYGNTSSAYTTDYEKNAVTGKRFSLEEVHGALSLTISNGYRGYHIPSCYVLHKEFVAATVTAGYSSTKGSYFNCNTTFDGATETYITPKNCALVLMAYDGTYPIVLTAALNNQSLSSTLSAGKNAGVNTGSNSNRWAFRFVTKNADGKTGFERNRDGNYTVELQSKDEIYVIVNSTDANFAGHWSWETEDKKWISWTGKKIEDFENHTSGIHETVHDQSQDGTIYNLKGQRVEQPQKGIYINNGKKYIAK